MSVEVLLILAIAVLASALLTQWLRLPGPIVLIAVGALLALLPPAREAFISPTIILTVFLPLMLYWESLSISLNQMKRGLRGIILSATVLVVITALAIAGIGVAMGLSLSAALLIGACLGPTDATAVSALGRNMDPQQKGFLQAESLLNDGTALAIFAIASQLASDGDSVTATSISIEFARDIGGGALVGIVWGAATVFLMRRVHTLDSPMPATLFTFIIPFAAFFLAESIEASGVLAVITTGVIVSRFVTGTGAGANLRSVGVPTWRFTSYILNALLFLSAGLSLPILISRMERTDVMRGLFLIPAVYLAMVGARFFGNYLIILGIRALDRRPEQKLRRTNLASRVLSTVAGFRGAISLAMATSIPLAFGGFEYAERDTIIVVVAGVVLLSLIVQGALLPLAVRWANANPSAGTIHGQRDQSMEVVTLGQNVRDLLEDLDQIAEDAGVDNPDVIAAVRSDYEHRRHTIMMLRDPRDYTVYSEEERRLREACVDYIRALVFAERNEGRIDESTFMDIRARNDIEMMMINGPGVADD